MSDPFGPLPWGEQVSGTDNSSFGSNPLAQETSPFSLLPLPTLSPATEPIRPGIWGFLGDFPAIPAKALITSVERFAENVRLGNVDPDEQGIKDIIATWVIENKKELEDAYPQVFKGPTVDKNTVLGKLRAGLFDGVSSALESLITMYAGRVAGAAIGTATGIPGGTVGGAIIGGAGSGGFLYAGSEYDKFSQEIYDYNKKNPTNPIPEEVWKPYALASAIQEGALEFGGDLVIGKFLTTLGLKNFSGSVRKILSTGTTWKPAELAKTWAKISASEVPTEALQSYFETELRGQAGLPLTESPMESAIDSIIPTLFSTLFFTGVAHRQSNKQRTKIENALTDANANMEVRHQAAEIIHKELQQVDKVNKTNLADQWAEYSVWHIMHNEPIDIDKSIVDYSSFSDLTKEALLKKQHEEDVAKFEARGNKEEAKPEMQEELRPENEEKARQLYGYEVFDFLKQSFIREGRSEERAIELAQRIMGAREPLKPPPATVASILTDESGQPIQRLASEVHKPESFTHEANKGTVMSLPAMIRKFALTKEGKEGTQEVFGSKAAVTKAIGESKRHKGYEPFQLGDKAWVGLPSYQANMITQAYQETKSPMKERPQVVGDNVPDEIRAANGKAFTTEGGAKVKLKKLDSKIPGVLNSYEIVKLGQLTEEGKEQWVARKKEVVRDSQNKPGVLSKEQQGPKLILPESYTGGRKEPVKTSRNVQEQQQETLPGKGVQKREPAKTAVVEPKGESTKVQGEKTEVVADTVEAAKEILDENKDNLDNVIVKAELEDGTIIEEKANEIVAKAKETRGRKKKAEGPVVEQGPKRKRGRPTKPESGQLDTEPAGETKVDTSAGTEKTGLKRVKEKVEKIKKLTRQQRFNNVKERLETGGEVTQEEVSEFVSLDRKYELVDGKWRERPAKTIKQREATKEAKNISEAIEKTKQEGKGPKIESHPYAQTKENNDDLTERHLMVKDGNLVPKPVANPTDMIISLSTMINNKLHGGEKSKVNMLQAASFIKQLIDAYNGGQLNWHFGNDIEKGQFGAELNNIYHFFALASKKIAFDAGVMKAWKREVTDNTRRLNTPLDVAKAVERLQVKLPGLPPVLVADKFDDPRVPPRLQALVMEAEKDSLVPAVLYDNVIFVFADQVNTEAQVAEAIFHEGVSHYGLATMLGEDYKPVLRQVYLGQKDNYDFKKIALRYRCDLSIDGDLSDKAGTRGRLLAADEYLADCAIRNAGPQSMWERIIAYVRNKLRGIGIVQTYNDTDIKDLFARSIRALSTEATYPFEALHNLVHARYNKGNNVVAPFYLGLSKALLESKDLPQNADKPIDVQRLNKFFQKNSIKPAELEWLDIKGFLKGKKTVTKNELLEHVRQNDPQLVKVIFTDLSQRQKSTKKNIVEFSAYYRMNGQLFTKDEALHYIDMNNLLEYTVSQPTNNIYHVTYDDPVSLEKRVTPIYADTQHEFDQAFEELKYIDANSLLDFYYAPQYRLEVHEHGRGRIFVADYNSFDDAVDRGEIETDTIANPDNNKFYHVIDIYENENTRRSTEAVNLSEDMVNADKNYVDTFMAKYNIYAEHTTAEDFEAIGIPFVEGWVGKAETNNGSGRMNTKHSYSTEEEAVLATEQGVREIALTSLNNKYFDALHEQLESEMSVRNSNILSGVTVLKLYSCVDANLLKQQQAALVQDESKKALLNKLPADVVDGRFLLCLYDIPFTRMRLNDTNTIAIVQDLETLEKRIYDRNGREIPFNELRVSKREMINYLAVRDGLGILDKQLYDKRIFDPTNNVTPEGYAGDPQHSTYQLKSSVLSNYVEFVLTWQLPHNLTKYTHGHWPGVRNPTVHARLNDLLTDGKKILYIDELQSDWATAASKYTTKDKTYEDRKQILTNKIDAINAEYNVQHQKIMSDRRNSGDKKLSNDEFKAIRKKQDELLEQRNELQEEMNRLLSAPEHGPMVADADTVYKHMLKQLLRYAAENHYDGIAWSPDWVQADRWSTELRQTVDRLEWKLVEPKEDIRPSKAARELHEREGYLINGRTYRSYNDALNAVFDSGRVTISNPVLREDGTTQVTVYRDGLQIWVVEAVDSNWANEQAREFRNEIVDNLVRDGYYGDVSQLQPVFYTYDNYNFPTKRDLAAYLKHVYGSDENIINSIDSIADNSRIINGLPLTDDGYSHFVRLWTSPDEDAENADEADEVFAIGPYRSMDEAEDIGDALASQLSTPGNQIVGMSEGIHKDIYVTEFEAILPETPPRILRSDRNTDTQAYVVDGVWYDDYGNAVESYLRRHDDPFPIEWSEAPESNVQGFPVDEAEVVHVGRIMDADTGEILVEYEDADFSDVEQHIISRYEDILFDFMQRFAVINNDTTNYEFEPVHVREDRFFNADFILNTPYGRTFILNADMGNTFELAEIVNGQAELVADNLSIEEAQNWVRERDNPYQRNLEQQSEESIKSILSVLNTVRHLSQPETESIWDRAIYYDPQYREDAGGNVFYIEPQEFARVCQELGYSDMTTAHVLNLVDEHNQRFQEADARIRTMTEARQVPHQTPGWDEINPAQHWEETEINYDQPAELIKMPKSPEIMLSGYDRDGRVRFHHRIPLKGETQIQSQNVSLDELLSEDIANKIRANPERGMVSTGNIMIGGKFYTLIYGEKVPSFFDKYSKQNNWEYSKETYVIPDAKNHREIDIGDVPVNGFVLSKKLKDDVLTVGQSKFMIRAKHGAYRLFAKFDRNKILSGEGVLAYGWGFYLTLSTGVASSYAKAAYSQHSGERRQKVYTPAYNQQQQLANDLRRQAGEIHYENRIKEQDYWTDEDYNELATKQTIKATPKLREFYRQILASDAAYLAQKEKQLDKYKSAPDKSVTRSEFQTKHTIADWITIKEKAYTRRYNIHQALKKIVEDPADFTISIPKRKLQEGEIPSSWGAKYTLKNTQGDSVVLPRHIIDNNKAYAAKALPELEELRKQASSATAKLNRMYAKLTEQITRPANVQDMGEFLVDVELFSGKEPGEYSLLDLDKPLDQQPSITIEQLDALQEAINKEYGRAREEYYFQFTKELMENATGDEQTPYSVDKFVNKFSNYFKPNDLSKAVRLVEEFNKVGAELNNQIDGEGYQLDSAAEDYADYENKLFSDLFDLVHPELMSIHKMFDYSKDTGRDLYAKLTNLSTQKIWNDKQMEASLFLDKNGISGNTYIGGSSDKRNYVIFNEDNIKVVGHKDLREPTVRKMIKVKHGGRDHTGFSSDYVGTGEGATAYGWGTYFTTLGEIARQYARSLKRRLAGGYPETYSIRVVGLTIGDKVLTPKEFAGLGTLPGNLARSAARGDSVKKKQKIIDRSIKVIAKNIPDDRYYDKQNVDNVYKFPENLIDYKQFTNPEPPSTWESTNDWSKTHTAKLKKDPSYIIYNSYNFWVKKNGEFRLNTKIAEYRGFDVYLTSQGDRAGELTRVSCYITPSDYTIVGLKHEDIANWGYGYRNKKKDSLPINEEEFINDASKYREVINKRCAAYEARGERAKKQIELIKNTPIDKLTATAQTHFSPGQAPDPNVKTTVFEVTLHPDKDPSEYDYIDLEQVVKASQAQKILDAIDKAPAEFKDKLQEYYKTLKNSMFYPDIEVSKVDNKYESQANNQYEYLFDSNNGSVDFEILELNDKGKQAFDYVKGKGQFMVSYYNHNTGDQDVLDRYYTLADVKTGIGKFLAEGSYFDYPPSTPRRFKLTWEDTTSTKLGWFGDEVNVKAAVVPGVNEVMYVTEERDENGLAIQYLLSSKNDLMDRGIDVFGSFNDAMHAAVEQLNEHFGEKTYYKDGAQVYFEMAKALAAPAGNRAVSPFGKEFEDAKKTTSLFLHSAGIDGNTYQGRSSGVRNYVVFYTQPEEGNIRIDKKYSLMRKPKDEETDTTVSKPKDGEVSKPGNGILVDNLDQLNPKLMKNLFGDEVKALIKTMEALRPSNLPAMTLMEEILKSPEYYSHPILRKIVDRAMERTDRYYELFNTLNNIDSEQTIIDKTIALRDKGMSLGQRIKGEVSPEYKQFEKIMDEIDTGEWKTDATDEDYMSHYLRKGVSKEILDLYILHRQAYDKALDLLMEPLAKTIDEIDKEAAKENKKPRYPEFQSYDEEGKIVTVNLKEALQTMGNMRGTYAPRMREIGEFQVVGTKGDKRVRFHKDSRFAAENLKRNLENQGYKIDPITERERLPEDVYGNLRLVSVHQAIDLAMKGTDLDNPELKMRFENELLNEISDIMKSRGFRSAMIKRKPGPVVRGYIVDPNERFVRYMSNLSAGIAKAEAAKDMFRYVTGYMEGEGQERHKVKGISSATERRAYNIAVRYIEEQLRNSDKADRAVALMKSIASFKYLGFSPRTLAVNILALATTVPTAIHQYVTGGKGSLMEIGKEITKASSDYVAIMRGKKLTNADEQRVVDEIKLKGYDSPQYMRDAMGTLQGTFGKTWMNSLKIALYGFQKSEQWIRGTTILAAYRLAKKQDPKMPHDTAVKLAHNASNKAHAVYGKPTLPSYAQGKNPAAKLFQVLYTFQKFPHNYLQMLYDVGFKKKNVKGFLFGFMSPVILAGGAVWPFKDLLFSIFGALLKMLGIHQDPEKWWWSGVRKLVGNKGEQVARHGVLGAMGIDVSGSLNINAGLPRNFYELFGVGGGLAKDTMDFMHYIDINQYGRAAEKLLPSGMANVVRALREVNMATTSKGNPVFTDKGEPYVPSGAETAARALGFRSAELATLTERTTEGKREEKHFADMRNNIYEQFRNWVVSGAKDQKEFDSLMQKVVQFNELVIKNDYGKRIPFITAASLKKQAIATHKPSKSEYLRLQD